MTAAYTKPAADAPDETELPEGEQAADEDESELLDNTEIQALIRAEVEDAKDFQESVLAPFRAEATKRYRGDLYGDEEEGRSSVISMDFRDTVMAILPSLVRIFLGTERPVEFMPRGPQDEELARERTDYINYVATEDNPGFRILHGAFKDALIRNYAILKWWWDDRKTVTNETYTGLTAGQVKQLAEDPEITDISYQQEGLEEGEEQPTELPEDELEGAPAEPSASPEEVQAPADAASAGAPSPKLFTVRVRRERKDGRACYQTVPGEEFFVSRNATTLEDAGIISHIRDVTRSDLIAMGYTQKFIEEHEGSGAFAFRLNEEFIARRPETMDRKYTEFNDNLKTTRYGEHLIRLDRDGDGIAELCMVCTIGDAFFVAKVEDAPEINYAILCPDPEPNELFGNGMYRTTQDIARIKTAVLRATLDSLRASIDPRTVVLEGQCNIDDVLNHEIGSVIREQQPGAVRQLDIAFVGQHGLTVLDYLDGVKEQRTGITKGSQGLNADAMQSTTAMAVAAQFSAAQQRIEMIARVLAETGIKDLYKGLQRLIMRNQDIARTIRLRGKWSEVDPRTWDAPMDVVVNVGLGNGMPADRILALKDIYAVQKDFLTTLGPTPMVDFNKIRYTLARGVELGGWNDPSAFFGEVPQGWAPPPPAEKLDPAMLLAKAQADEIQARLKIEAGKLAQAQQKLLLETETARMKLEMDMQVRLAEIEANTGRDINEQRINAAVEHARMRTEAVIRAHEAETDHNARVDEANLASRAGAAAQAQPQGGEPA